MKEMLPVPPIELMTDPPETTTPSAGVAILPPAPVRRISPAAEVVRNPDTKTPYEEASAVPPVPIRVMSAPKVVLRVPLAIWIP